MRMSEGMGNEVQNVMKHRDLVRKAAVKFLGKNYNEWADDITQDVMLKALLNFNKFNASKGNLEAWMYTMTRNMCFDFMAKKANSLNNITLDESFLLFGEEEKMFNSKDLRRQMRYALDRLSELDRTLLVMRFFFKCNGREISKMTGIAEKQIASRLLRAKERLRGIMERECGF